METNKTKTKTKTKWNEPIRSFTKQPTQTVDGLRWSETPEKIKPQTKRMD